MEPMVTALWIILGFVGGALVAAGAAVLLRRRAQALAQQTAEEVRLREEQQRQALVESIRRDFAALSREALSANADDFLRLAATRFEQQRVQADQTLESKKKLIDAKLEEMSGSLQRVNNLLQEVNKQRAESHASLKTELERATQATNRLHDTTAQLREALANPQRRGQWGERMAEDVLRLAGFIEGVNYFKQQSDGAGNRPDFTFPLPDNRKVNMDVKFPLANYLRMLESEDELQRASLRSAFLRDMRSRVKEVTTRDYIDPAGGTVDYVLVFIPNEQIYSFIHEHDATLLDEALRNRVVLCSPLTLYAILAVIRQAAENFRLEQGSRQILQLLGEFKKQWTRYCESMETMGKRLEAAMKEYGELTGVRTRQLDRQLDKIDDLRAATEHEPTEQPTRSLP
jgi:DNA recombination protein RmuC